MKNISLHIYLFLSLGLCLAILAGCQKSVYDELNSEACSQRTTEVDVSLDLQLSAPVSGSLRMSADGEVVSPEFTDNGKVEGLGKESEIASLRIYLFKSTDGSDNDDAKFEFVETFPATRLYRYDEAVTDELEKACYRTYFKIRDIKGVYKLLVAANISDDNTYDYLISKEDPDSPDKTLTLKKFKEKTHWEIRNINFMSIKPGEALLPMSGESEAFDLADATKMEEDPDFYTLTKKKVYRINTKANPIEMQRTVARLDISYTNAKAFATYAKPTEALSANNKYLRLKRIQLVIIRNATYLFPYTPEKGDPPYFLSRYVTSKYPNVYHEDGSYPLYVAPEAANAAASRHKNVSLVAEDTKAPHDLGGLFSLQGSFYSGVYKKASSGLSNVWLNRSERDPQRDWHTRCTCLHVILEDELGQDYFYYIPIGELYGKDADAPISDTNPVEFTGLNRNTIYKLEVEQHGYDLKVLFFKFAVAKEKEVELPPITIYPDNGQPDNSSTNTRP